MESYIEGSMKLGDGNPKPAGTWDYYGEGDPAHHPNGIPIWRTFTVGVFQWVPKSGGGTKKSKSIKRIKGYTEFPGEVYLKAQSLILRQMER